MATSTPEPFSSSRRLVVDDTTATNATHLHRHISTNTQKLLALTGAVGAIGAACVATRMSRVQVTPASTTTTTATPVLLWAAAAATGACIAATSMQRMGTSPEPPTATSLPVGAVSDVPSTPEPAAATTLILDVPFASPAAAAAPACITSRQLCDAAADAGFNGWSRVERLLLRTQRLSTATTATTAAMTAASLAPEALAFLSMRCPRLALVAIDANPAAVFETPPTPALTVLHAVNLFAASLERVGGPMLDQSGSTIDLSALLERSASPPAAATAAAVPENGAHVAEFGDDDSLSSADEDDTDAATSSFGLLGPPRFGGASVLPPEPAWDALRDVAARFMVGPPAATVEAVVDASAYRTAILAMEQTKHASAMEAALDAASDVEVAQVYSTLTLMARKFVEGGGGAANAAAAAVPRCIFRPWKKAAALRGAPATLAHAHAAAIGIATVTDNWCLRVPTRPATIDNVDALVTATGTDAEYRFIQLHVALEAAGGSIPERMLTLKTELDRLPDPPARVRCLNQFMDEAEQRLACMTATLGCHMRDAVLPPGDYDGGFPTPLVVVALDRFLGVEHIDTTKRCGDLTPRQLHVLRTLNHAAVDTHAHASLQAACLASRHRTFHDALLATSNLRELVELYGDDSNLVRFNMCVLALGRWRQEQHNVAATAAAAASAHPLSTSVRRPSLSNASAVDSEARPLLLILAQLVEETRAARIVRV